MNIITGLSVQVNPFTCQYQTKVVYVTTISTFKSNFFLSRKTCLTIHNYAARLFILILTKSNVYKTFYLLNQMIPILCQTHQKVQEE